MNAADKKALYRELHQRLSALTDGESDEIALMATLVCEVHHALPYSHWTGFYRVTEPGMLKVGPYQGGHGCLQISFDRGVCGRAARERAVQLVDDVEALPYHIACSSSTRSEIVLPVLDKRGQVRAVLDLDSDDYGAFCAEDERGLTALIALISHCFD
ncbi:GAF domain-containing protein [Simiduia agarivorans]|uniref:GAF domain-containing protein n=1 Tax=Simiduia agarivorans (strain DSM 21679 / JCM 13881 / BCRC 17597 / SA1) TaxID=1117647 RepID=K4KQ59_SIMAS|nr:GAF domain-containing protein [Simiduia agarivorans]AFV00249.1 GAF domain-containing protein [Simiduia agarivorans SA1 = DSM 21679]